MKLLISLSYYSPHISGLTLSMQNLAELLAANGYQVTVLAAQHEKRLTQNENIKGVKVVRVPYLFRLSKGFVMPGFSRVAFGLLKKNDAVLITLPQAQSLIMALLAKMLGKKIICFYICEVSFPGGLKGKIIDLLIRLVNPLTLLFADSVVTLTDDFAKHNDILQKSGKEVTGIYPVVIPPKIYQKEIEEIKNKLPDKKYYIGYLGRIASEKGIEFLLEAIPDLQKELSHDFVIVLAGPKRTVGEDVYKNKIEVLVAKNRDYIVQIGEMTDDQLGAFYSLLDVFILPSTNNTEAFGMVQVEAMYCGTPVVATDLPGVRVPVRETEMGEIVPPGNTTSLAAAIVKVLQNKKQYVKEKSVIADIFSAEKILKKYTEILH